MRVFVYREPAYNLRQVIWFLHLEDMWELLPWGCALVAGQGWSTL